jgi:hypothetical protein
MVKPTPERANFDPIDPPPMVPIVDALGGFGAPHKVKDTLDTMLAAQTITRAMWRAGRRFRKEFKLGHVDPLHGQPWERNSRGPREETDRQVDARSSIVGALNALGGVGTIMGQCAWCVLGGQKSLTQWAQDTRRDRGAAAGILIAVLDQLARFYGV